MKFSRASLLSISLLSATLFMPASQAAFIENGDFGTGDFTGWLTDTDGFPGSPNDFSVVGAPGNQAARIEADYWDAPGDVFSFPLNDVYFANTIYQEIDTTTTSGYLSLSFDWIFGGEDADPISNEYFMVGLNDGFGGYYGSDGNLGFLIDPTITYGSGSFTAILDEATFANSAGWFLDFQLGVGADEFGWNNAYGSFVEISNVQLADSTGPVGVPEPSSLILIITGLMGFYTFNKKRS